MYSYDAPADGIRELVSFLQREDRGKHLYRGQVKHYGSVVPSVFRPALTGERLSKHVHAVSMDKFHAPQAIRAKLRFSLLDHLIAQLGRGVGNLVAQQYGLASEAIDVTADPVIAAYFATRNYPKYEHHHGTAENQLGVIYRFPKRRRTRDAGELEATLEMLGHRAPGKGTSRRWFSRRVSRWSSSEALESVESILDKRRRETLVLSSPWAVVEYADLSEYLLHGLANRLGLVPRDYQQTRIARQRGGFIRPPMHVRCTVPADRILAETSTRGRQFYEPPTVVAEEVVGVEDAMAFPGFELFFFRHSAEEITTLSNQHLWPSAVRDDVYEHLCNLLLRERAVGEHLEQHDTWLEDPDVGVIDRGFYSGIERKAWKARAEQRDGNTRIARQLADEVVAAEPNNAEYHQLRGWIAFEGGDVRSALDDFAKALDIEPDHWPSAVSRAAALAAQGELEPALSTLTNAIVAHPRRAALYLERAKLHARSSLHARAVADCERGLTVLAPGAETIQLEPDLLRLAVLAHTADGNDGPAETVLARLSRIEDVSPLRTHIQGMRTARRAP